MRIERIVTHSVWIQQLNQLTAMDKGPLTPAIYRCELLHELFNKVECIPVGCVLLAAVAVSGVSTQVCVCPRRGVHTPWPRSRHPTSGEQNHRHNDNAMMLLGAKMSQCLSGSGCSKDQENYDWTTAELISQLFIEVTSTAHSLYRNSVQMCRW